MKSNPLDENIVFTLAYFGAMNYPLTLFELWRNLFQVNSGRERFSFLEVQTALKNKKLLKSISQKDGMFFLKGDEELVKKRSVAYKISTSKLRRLRKWVKMLEIVPFVRGAFLTGTLSMKNAKSNSDWDILLVLAKGRIWIGRLLVAIVLQLTAKRRHGNKVKERFCLNHYITENGLILEEYNEFSANFVSTSMFLIGGAIYKRFLQMNEFWIQGIKPNYTKEEVFENDVINLERVGFIMMMQESIEFLLEKTRIANLINDFSRRIMIKKIKKNPKTYWKDADIRYSETALVFLPKPHRITMIKEANKRMQQLN